VLSRNRIVALQREAFTTAYNPVSYQELCVALCDAGLFDYARDVFARWEAIDGASPIVAHLRAACLGGSAPSRASDAYVVAEFDAFAPTFDRAMRNLGYAVPDLVASALAAIRLAPDAAALDLGCGTGLCGPALRRAARRVIGVDLSPAMAAAARERGCYDEILIEELTAHLDRSPRAYDVIVAADVLVYFGALDRVWAGVASSLRSGGRVVFSVERAEDGVAFRLNRSGRYAHGERYVRASLAEQGLSVESCEGVYLRSEGGAPVEGLFVAATR
jgi:predicted TPR repeat methyltransferase